MRYFTTSLLFLAGIAYAQEGDGQSAECKAALEACENDLECSNRLAPLTAACSTSTCQPQCRNAVLNVYQNKLGRALLKSDGTCVPGREELKMCNFMPLGAQVHCSLAKLACEADLQCNSKWNVFTSECEQELARGECSPSCKDRLLQATSTPSGSAFVNCSCTEREDHLCQNLRDNMLAPCNKPSSATTKITDNSITESPRHDASAASATYPTVLLVTLLAIRLYLSL